MGTSSFPEVKRPGLEFDHPPSPSSADFKERIELLLYSLYGPSCLVLGRTLLAPSICAKTGWTKFGFHLTKEAKRVLTIKQIWNKQIYPHLLPTSNLQGHLQGKHGY